MFERLSSPVFVERVTSKSAKGKVYETFLIRESVRTPEGPRSRTVCNISALPPQTRDLIAASLKGLSFVQPETATLKNALDFGGVAVLRDAWQRFGLADLWPDIPKLHAGRLQAMVFSRLLHPCAKLSLTDKARGTLLALACDLPAEESFDEDDLYLAMDQLVGRWAPISQTLYKKAFPRKVTIALYDITSIYFEGKGPKGLAKYGHSRDHRPDRLQVNLAVVTDQSGVPISLSVLRGNRADNKTLLGLLKLLKRRFDIDQATFVFDGGMSGEINLQAMSEAGLSYVTRLSNSTLHSLLQESTETATQIEQLELGDKPQLIEITHDGKRYVLAGGAWRAQRDKERREARIKKGEALLTQLATRQRKKVNAQRLASTVGRALEKAKAHKYFTYEVDEAGQLQWARKADIIKDEQSRDGWYLLHTNQTPEQCPTAQVLRDYKSLLEVEDAFRELKTYLEVRPIYHWKPRRVITHIRLCFLAYWISARLAREWQMAGEHAEVVRLLRSLQTIRIGQLEFNGDVQQTLMTSVPSDLEGCLDSLGLRKLFQSPPKWASPSL